MNKLFIFIVYVLLFTVLTVGIGLTIKSIWQGQNIDIMNLIYFASIACGLACILRLHIKKNQ